MKYPVHWIPQPVIGVTEPAQLQGGEQPQKPTMTFKLVEPNSSVDVFAPSLEVALPQLFHLIVTEGPTAEDVYDAQQLKRYPPTVVVLDSNGKLSRVSVHMEALTNPSDWDRKFRRVGTVRMQKIADL